MAADSPSEAVVVGVIGVNGRGRALADTFATIGGARVAYDLRRRPAGHRPHAQCARRKDSNGSPRE